MRSDVFRLAQSNQVRELQSHTKCRNGYSAKPAKDPSLFNRSVTFWRSGSLSIYAWVLLTCVDGMLQDFQTSSGQAISPVMRSGRITPPPKRPPRELKAH